MDNVSKCGIIPSDSFADIKIFPQNMAFKDSSWLILETMVTDNQ